MAKKIAFIVPPFLGHIYPTLGVGAELIRRGYSVCWLSMYEHMSGLIPDGGNCIELKAYLPDTLPEISFGMNSLQGLYEKILLPLGTAMYHEVRPYIQFGNFDVIITDHQAFAGAILAYEFNIPYITSVTAPAAIERSKDFPEVINYEHSQIIKLQQSLGIALEEPLVCHSPLTLVYSTRQFLQTDDFPPGYQFVGPSIKGRAEQRDLIQEIEDLDDFRPKVLVTLGSLLKCDHGFIDKVIEAFKDEDFTIILLADPKLKDQWPDNFLVYAHIPQLWVLEKVQAVICHAGYNTVCEALSFGLPLITLPIVNDQSHVATKVARCGAGIRLKYKRLKSNHLKTSLREIFSDPAYRVAAQKIKESFAEAGGSIQAAKLIEQFMYHQKVSVDQTDTQLYNYLN